MRRRWLDPETAPTSARSTPRRSAGARRGLARRRATPTSCTTRSLTAGLGDGRAKAGARAGSRCSLRARRRRGGPWQVTAGAGERSGSRPSGCRRLGRSIRRRGLQPRRGAAGAAGARAWTPEEAWSSWCADRLEGIGPVTAEGLAARFGRQAVRDATLALAALEGRGVRAARPLHLRRRRPSGASAGCWRASTATPSTACGAEIEPVAPADFLRFLLDWQRVDPDERMEGPESVQALLEQLEGFEAPAAAWEGEILPARIEEYDPVWLDALCLAGRWLWGGDRSAANGTNSGTRKTGPVRARRSSLLARPSLPLWREWLRVPIRPRWTCRRARGRSTTT